MHGHPELLRTSGNELFRGDGAIIDLVDADPRRSAPLRVVLGSPVPGQGVRGRDPQPGLDPGGQPVALAPRQRGVVAPRRRRCGARRSRRWSAGGATRRTRSMLVSTPSTSRASCPSPTRSSPSHSGSPWVRCCVACCRAWLPRWPSSSGIRAAIGVYLRPHYVTAVTKVLSLFGAKGAPPRCLDLVPRAGESHGHLPRCRHRLRLWSDPGRLPARSFPGGKGLLGQCLSSHGFHQLVTYQPDSRFWAFQGIEAGIFLVLTVGLVGFASWRVLARDA